MSLHRTGRHPAQPSTVVPTDDANYFPVNAALSSHLRDGPAAIVHRHVRDGRPDRVSRHRNMPRQPKSQKYMLRGIIPLMAFLVFYYPIDLIHVKGNG